MIFASFAKILVSFAKILVSFTKILVSLLNLLLIFSKHAILTNFSMYTGAKTRKHGSGIQIKLRLRPMGVTDRQTHRQTDRHTDEHHEFRGSPTQKALRAIIKYVINRTWRTPQSDANCLPFPGFLN